MRPWRLGIQQPELIDVVAGSRLCPYAVGGYLMRGAGEPDFPDRTLLTVTHDRDNRHRRKIRGVASNNRRDKERKRQRRKDRRHTTPIEDAVPKPLNHRSLTLLWSRVSRSRLSFNLNPGPIRRLNGGSWF